MNLSLLSLVGLTLLLCGGVAAVPTVVRQGEPRSRPQPPGPPLQELWIVQAPGDRWFLAGRPIRRADLGRSLRRAGEARVQFLPSAALPLGEVSTSLAWLRSQGSLAVQLALPPRP
jgi:hypothetical protein